MKQVVAALALAALASGCATSTEEPPSSEKVGQSESAFSEAFAMEESADQGGCSNAQIRRCVGLCGGTVNACYDTPDTAEYSCHCRNGKVWTGVDNLVNR